MSPFEESIVALMEKRVETALECMQQADFVGPEQRIKLHGAVHMSLAILREHLATMVKLNEAERELEQKAKERPNGNG